MTNISAFEKLHTVLTRMFDKKYPPERLAEQMFIFKTQRGIPPEIYTTLLWNNFVNKTIYRVAKKYNIK